MRQFNKNQQIIVASHNEGKVSEIKELLYKIDLNAVSAKKFKLTEPPETANSFQGNAKIKALTAARKTGIISLGDDSGLVVPSIQYKPGIYSARWGGPKKNFSFAMQKVQKKLGKKDSFAWFTSALALAWPDSFTITFVGRVYGNLVWPPRGKLGFGYDPMFKPLGYKLTFGQIKPEIKNRISHRSLAFKNLVNFLSKNNS